MKSTAVTGYSSGKSVGHVNEIIECYIALIALITQMDGPMNVCKYTMILRLIVRRMQE